MRGTESRMADRLSVFERQIAMIQGARGIHYRWNVRAPFAQTTVAGHRVENEVSRSFKPDSDQPHG